MYPVLLRDHTGDHPVVLVELGDVYVLGLLILFIVLLLFIVYRHLGLL